MHTTKLRVLLFGLFASAGALALSGCGSDSEGTIQIYTGRHYDLEVAFEAFAEEFNIGIEFLSGPDADLRERLQAEGDDTSPAAASCACIRWPTSPRAASTPFWCIPCVGTA